jgi:hypothetical protein
MEDDKEVLRFTWSDEKGMWWMGPVKGMSILKRARKSPSRTIPVVQAPAAEFEDG